MSKAVAPCQLMPGAARPASWIIASRAGRAILETYQPSVAAKVNTARYTVWTAHAWLAHINRKGAR